MGKVPTKTDVLRVRSAQMSDPEQTERMSAGGPLFKWMPYMKNHTYVPDESGQGPFRSPLGSFK